VPEIVARLTLTVPASWRRFRAEVAEPEFYFGFLSLPGVCDGVVPKHPHVVHVVVIP
jgi:hypothetical protein